MHSCGIWRVLIPTEQNQTLPFIQNFLSSDNTPFGSYHLELKAVNICVPLARIEGLSSGDRWICFLSSLSIFFFFAWKIIIQHTFHLRWELLEVVSTKRTQEVEPWEYYCWHIAWWYYSGRMGARVESRWRRSAYLAQEAPVFCEVV